MGDFQDTIDLTARSLDWVRKARLGPLERFLQGDSRLEVGLMEPRAEGATQDVVVAAFQLQNITDYRRAIQSWFRPLRVGGHMIIAVPHAFLYERQLALPSRWDPRHRRLYTPASLLGEIEEALPANAYRVRHLSDHDAGYNYATTLEAVPIGESDIVAVIEKITPPQWYPAVVAEAAPPLPRPDTPNYEFEPPRTRVEVEATVRPRRILILKLDHLGDFIMGLSALERARTLFADAELTLVVGSWNAQIARETGLADHVISFDVFPRNSSEEEVDVPGKAALFQATVTEEYDLAIDLRVDTDTRNLLRLVNSPLRAGIGTRAHFRHLDIFLPVDFNRNEVETAREFLLSHYAFACQGSTRRTEHQILSFAETTERDCAVVWGPYQPLRSGRYFFEPHFDIPAGQTGLLMLDVALDAQRKAQAFVESAGRVRIPFEVEENGARFEFRIWAVDGAPALDIQFFGGRLVREGAASVLHQSEYMLLLIELVAMRLARSGVLTELGV